MATFLKVLTKIGTVLKYINVFRYVYKGLVVADASLTTATEVLKTEVPDFKHLDKFLSVLKYIRIVEGAVGTFVSVFGTDVIALRAEVAASDDSVGALSVDSKLDMISQKIEIEMER